jgi:hypothetical protein
LRIQAAGAMIESMKLATLPFLAASLMLAACSGETSSPAQQPGPGDSGVESSGGSGGDAQAEGTAGAQPDAPAEAFADSQSDTPQETAADSGMRGSCSSEADCSGKTCLQVPVDPEGWHTCEQKPEEMTTCNDPSLDECCKSSECTSGTGGCFSSTLFYCGGPQPQEYNVCLYSACVTSESCTQKPHGVCVSAGAFSEPVNRCVYGGCVLDAECKSRAGGACGPFFDPCNHRFEGFFCTYDDSPCRSDADCTGAETYCNPGDDGHTTCETYYPPP